MPIDVRTLEKLANEPQALLMHLKALSNSRFRQASRELGESVLVELDNQHFWAVFHVLFHDNRKAYLGTLLKALAARIANRDYGSDSGMTEADALLGKDFAILCSEMTDTDRKKTLLTLLPLISCPTTAERLLLQCGLHESPTWIPFLLHVRTAPCAFLLLKAMRYVEHDRALLIRTCHFLIKNGDGLSFNLASLIRASFALEEVRGTFSLTLKPYELARIEQNYDAFLRTIRF